MNSAIRGIHHDAVKHSMRAARLWRESAAVFDSVASGRRMRSEEMRRAAELNEKALDECRQALRSIEFIRRYRQSEN